jgi:hypothetical protein
MTDKISVNCQAKLSEAITKLSTMFRDKKFVVVSLRPGKDRTLDQNALWFAMYKRISEMTQIGDAADARRRGIGSCAICHTKRSWPSWASTSSSARTDSR